MYTKLVTIAHQIVWIWIFFVVFAITNIYSQIDQKILIYVLPISIIKAFSSFRIEAVNVLANGLSFHGYLYLLGITGTKYFLLFGREIAVFLVSVNILPYFAVELRFPDWLKPLLGENNEVGTVQENQQYASPSAEYCLSKEPPPLEEIDPTLSVFPSPCGWCVFNPVFGVIPKETNDLWIQQERERDQLKSKYMKHHKKKLPPVRYSSA